MIEYRLGYFLNDINKFKSLFKNTINELPLILRFIYIIYFKIVKKKLKKNIIKINKIDYNTLIDFCEYINVNNDDCKTKIKFNEYNDNNVEITVNIPNSTISIYTRDPDMKRIYIKITDNNNVIYNKNYINEIIDDDKIINDAVYVVLMVIRKYIMKYIDDEI